MAIPYNPKIEEYGIKCWIPQWLDYVDNAGTFITPNGDFIDVHNLSRYKLGGHDTIYRETTVYEEYIAFELLGNRNKPKEVVEDLEKEKKQLEKKLSYFAENILLRSLTQIDLDLCNFFIRCYSNTDKVKVVEKDIPGWSHKDYYFDISDICNLPISFNWELVKNPYYSKNWNDGQQEYDSKNYYNERLWKEILVRHLGYESVESNRPKTITTSSWNIYERFYNYLLMDYSIQQISRFIYDEDKGIYVERPLTEEHYIDEKDEKGNIIDRKKVLMNLRDFFTSDSELRLKDEIQAIKRLVPLNERTKYFR